MSNISNHALTWTATRINTVVLVFTLVSGLVVFLRLFTRFVLSKAAGLEDACIAIAMVSVFPSHPDNTYLSSEDTVWSFGRDRCSTSDAWNGTTLFDVGQ